MDGAKLMLDDQGVCTLNDLCREETMLNAIDKQILKEVAGFEDVPKGLITYAKRETARQEVSANIEILTHEEKSGIVVEIAPGTKNESLHIPVILSQAGLHDTVYNTFIIGEDADVTIIAGCGIHCGSSEPEGHSGIHEFVIKKRPDGVCGKTYRNRQRDRETHPQSDNKGFSGGECKS